MKKENETSWGKVAGWYDEYLKSADGTYQKEVILPNLLRTMEIKKGEKVLDLACGQGFFSREFVRAGALVTGVDISPELIAIAKKDAPKEAEFHVVPADKASFLKDETFDKVAIVLAIQNIENLDGVLSECKRVLKKGGKLFLVMTHPAFRNQQKTDWGFDEKKAVQYRRVEEYLSESKIVIKMHPGKEKSEETISFHRPLQLYFKFLRKNGLAVTRLEEWVSNKKSQKGPREKAEDKARHEIPLFLLLESLKF